jgi:hypothetical protein
MNDPARLPSPEPAPRAGHETTDVSPSYVGLFALGLALMIAIVLPLLSWIFWRFEAAALRADSPQSLVVGDQTIPPPVLQDDPAADLAVLRRDEERRLSSYGWIDSQQRSVRVPIERAIEILSKRGLPEPEGPRKPAQAQERTP